MVTWFPLAVFLMLAVIAGIVVLVAQWAPRGGGSQFSLRSIFLWTAYVALLLAVFNGEPTPDFWSLVLAPPAVGSLAVATLGIIYRAGERRAYWTGLALFGFAYLFTAWLMDFAPRRWFSYPGSIVLALYPPVAAIGSMVGRYFYLTQNAPPTPNRDEESTL